MRTTKIIVVTTKPAYAMTVVNMGWFLCFEESLDTQSNTVISYSQLLFSTTDKYNKRYVTMKYESLKEKNNFRQVKDQNVGDSHMLYEDENWLIVIPLDKDASCFYGNQTDKAWCFSNKNNSQFEDYFFDKLYTIIFCIQKKKKDRWALVIGKNNKLEIWDKNDKQIDQHIFEDVTGLKVKDIKAKSEAIEISSNIEKNREKYKKSIDKLDSLIQNVSKGKPNLEIENLLIYTKNAKKIKQYIDKIGASDKYSLSFQFVAVNIHGDFIRFFKNTENLVMVDAVHSNPHSIRWIADFADENVKLVAVNINGHVIEYIKDANERIQLAAVSEDGLALGFIDNPSSDVALAAVSQNGFALQFIHNPSEDIQIAAVRHNGKAIRYISNPSERVSRESVHRNGLALEYIENPSELVKLIAVRKNGNAIKFIRDPDEKTQLAAVSNNGNSIQHIHEPSERVKAVAVKENPHAMKHINKASQQLKKANIKIK